MENYVEINPIDKKRSLCSLLEKLNYKYEIHTLEDKEYEYMNSEDICITIPNLTCEYALYIDLENEGEFTLSYYKWHTHYLDEECEYDRLCKDLVDILNNEKCVIVINSNEDWLHSGLSETKIDKDYNYKNDIKRLPKKSQKEIRKLKGNIELFYWDIKDNVVIDI